jgi:DNA-binding HxlR family transcriptional regulator
MTTYGQYCPIAQALDILGDRWTLLIIRDMLSGTRHFNALQRGLPGLSRALLSKRLRQLQQAGIIKKYHQMNGHRTTEYRLTQAGDELQSIIQALLIWGCRWSFSDPTPDKLDPLLLMWWIHQRVNVEHLPETRTVIQFDFYGAARATYWLVLHRSDVTLCITDPGYEISVWVRADLADFFKLWLGRISYAEALAGELSIEGSPGLISAFPNWFAWSHAAPMVREMLQIAQPTVAIL